MFLTLTITSNVNAMSNASNNKQKITKDMTFNGVESKSLIENEDSESLEEDKIMEYDATTGITKEVDMKELRKSLAVKNARNGGYSDRIEPYNPLANTSSNENISPRAIYNPVTNVSTTPYSAICRIKADVYGKELVASGYMAGARVVVTSAHCVMNRDDNDNFYTEWNAYPGYSNGSSYNGLYCGWSKVYYPNKWKTTHSIEYDWCVCILYSDLGNSTGWLGSQKYGVSSDMNGLSVRLFGYPLVMGDGERQVYTQGSILSTQDGYFESSARSSSGLSGGPFLRTSDNYVVGIDHGTSQNNSYISGGTRINQTIIDLINENS